MKIRTILLNLAVAFIALVVLFPLVWMVSVSFMAPGEAAVFPPPLWPKTWTLEHYCDLFLNQGMGRYLWNSFALATLATILALGFTVPAGYAFAKLRFTGRERLFQFLVAALVVPAQIGTLPLSGGRGIGMNIAVGIAAITGAGLLALRQRKTSSFGRSA